MTAVFDQPLVDPEGPLWVRDPSESAKVSAALDAATVAAGEAQLCWRRLQEALEGNIDVPARVAAFGIAAAQSRYAWAVYHSTAADATVRVA